MAKMSLENIAGIVVAMVTGLSVVHCVALRHLPDPDDWNKSMEKSEVEFGSGMSTLTLKNARAMAFLDTSSHASQTSVDHFARHGLCRHKKGKQHFYRALKSKLCQKKDGFDSFTESLVEDLCKDKQRYMLNKWVAELFDTDHDGYISHYEKIHYLHDD